MLRQSPINFISATVTVTFMYSSCLKILLLANGANFSQTAIYSLCGLDRIIMMNLKSYNSLKINTTNIKTLKCLLCVVIHHCRFDID